MNKKVKVLIGTGLSILSISLLNKFIFYKSTLKNKLFSYHKHYYDWRYGKIFYTVQGSGKPLLLIHGIGSGANGKIWDQLIPTLAENYTVYTIDLLGFGRSDKPKITYTAYLYVQLINDFIEKVIKKPTNIIASSLSSAFVTMCAHQNEDLFNKMMFINPLDLGKLSSYPKKLSKINKKIFESPIIGTSIYNMISSKYGCKRFLETKCFYNPDKLSNKLVDIFYESAHLGGACSKYVTASFFTKYMNIDIRKSIAAIDKSIYIVWSKDNDFNNESVIDQYLNINPSIEYSVIDNTKLLPHVEKPESFLTICSIFFS